MNLARIRALARKLTGRSEFEVAAHFGRIYERNLFGGDESVSGQGSTWEQTAVIRRELPQLFQRRGVRSVLDAPCGDGHWIMALDWSVIAYTGVDVVPALIQANTVRHADRSGRFLVGDLCRDPLPPADLILCRDCWVHLDFRQIKACLVNFRRSGAKYLLTTTFPAHPRNRDLMGLIWRPLNLQAPPFNFPAPLDVIVEGCTEEGGRFADKALACWNLPELAP